MWLSLSEFWTILIQIINIFVWQNMSSKDREKIKTSLVPFSVDFLLCTHINWQKFNWTNVLDWKKKTKNKKQKKNKKHFRTNETNLQQACHY